MPHPAAVGTHPPSSPTSTSSASSTSSRSSRRATANTTSGRQRHPGAHRESNTNRSNPPKSTNTKINTTCGQQPKSQSTVNQRQQPVKQHNTLTPPSTERTGPEGEADEEEPSEIDSFLLDDNDIESEEENLTRTSNSSPIPTIDQLSPDKEYLGEDNEEEEDSDDLDADLQTVNSIASSASHRRFLLTENLLSSAESLPPEEYRVAGDGKEPENQPSHPHHIAHLCANLSTDTAAEASKISVATTREKIGKGVKTTLIGSVSSEITTRPSKLSSKGSNTSTALPADIHPVDPETQARLEALLEAAGIGKLTGETKQLTDPEVLKRLTSSVSCALDEAAAALTRMRTDPPGDGRSLVEACNEGDISKVRKLLDEGRVSVHDTTEEGESLLSLACSAGYFELAQVLLAMRANVEDRGMKGDCTPLMEAASAGHNEIVKLLLSHNAEVNAQSSSGNTPLMYACAGGHEDVVQMLLEAHANVEDHNENGHTPLMEAASAGHVGVAKILLKNGAGINTHSNEFKESALTLACYKGHLEMVRFLLDAGADQEHKTDEMHTALMEASMDGHVEVARLLLDSGAQVNMPADSFESPLTLAACGGHVELAMLLLERGANIEEVNDEGYTPLMEASREGHEEMVALLLSQGADINAQTEETQETALTLACCGGFLEVADFLIKAGANIELGASTPLMESAQEGHIELTKYLLQNGADVNAQSGTGDTALTYACENGHTDVSDLLLKYNAVLEHESEGGRTPLMKAARAGHLCTVQFLISKGADVNRTTTNNDHTPLSLACAGGHISIVELLLQHGADPYHKLKDNSTMLIEAAKGGHTNVVSILIDYPNSLVMTNEAAMSAAAFNDPINGPPQASIGVIHPANQATSHHLNASAVHAGQVSIGGQMTQEQMAIAMQHDQNNTQVVGGTQLATAHLQQTAKNINIIPTGQLNNTSVVSGPAPPPPPPPPTNQQNKSVLRKSQRTCSSATGTANQSLNNSLSAAKESSGNKDPSTKLNGKGNTSSLASSAARSILSSAAAGITGAGMPPNSAQNIGIDASGFDYIEGSGFVMEGLEDKGLDAKSYIQSVLRRHEGGATREEQIIQKEQILAELQRVEKELKEKGPSAAPNTTAPAPGVSGSNIGQQYSTSCHKGGITGGNTSISLNIPAATEILQNMANLTLQDQHHRGGEHHPCSSTVTSSTQTVQVTNQNCPTASHASVTACNLNAAGQEQGLNASSLVTGGNGGKRASSSNNNANLANLLPIERPKVKASRKIPGKESLSPSSKDSNILTTSSASTSPGGSISTNAGTAQLQNASQACSLTNIAGSLSSLQDTAQSQQVKKSDSQLQAARHQHSQQLAQLQQLQQLNQQLQEQVLYQRQQKQQNQATLAALQQNAIANQQQLAALQQNVAQLQQLEQHILQQQQATSHTGSDNASVSTSTGGPQSSSPCNSTSSANSTQSSTISANQTSNNNSAANQQHQQLQGKIQQIVQQKQQLQAQIKQFQQQVEQQLAYTQNATPGTTIGQLSRDGVNPIGPSESMSHNQSTTTRTSNKRSKDNSAHPSSNVKDANNTSHGVKQDSIPSVRPSGNNKNSRSKIQGTGSLQSSSEEGQPASSVANAAYELVQASQALQAVQALQQQHLETSSASSSNPTLTTVCSGDVEPLAQDPSLLTSLDPAHLAAAVQNCPLPLDANCQAILNGYKEGMQAGQALATTLQAAVNSGSMQIQYPVQVQGSAQGGSTDYNNSASQPCQLGNQSLTGGVGNQMTATSIGLDQLLLQGPQFPFGQASVDSNGQINFSSATDLPSSSYIHHQGNNGNNTSDTSALFLPAGAQLSVPPSDHGQLVLHQSGQMLSQHGQLQPELPGVIQCPSGALDCLDSSLTSPTCSSGGVAGKKTKHGGSNCSKNKKLQQVAHSQDIQDALDRQGGQASDLFSAAAAAAAAAATAGIPVPSGAITGQAQAGILPANCSAAATLEAQQYAQTYANAACGPDGVPLPGAQGPGIDGFDANNEAVAAAAAAAAAAVSVDLDSATESNHDTALTLACAGGHEDLVTLLLGRGSDIEHRDKKGFTPLILAATAGHEKVVEILLEHNADIEAQSERTKDTPLSLACSGGRYEVVEVLLKKHANKEHRNVSDYTPLSLAASGGYVNIIKLLLAHGAEINSRTGSKLGISPLMLAAMNGHTASVKLLLDMGSDINAQIETNRNTALTLACFQGRHEVVSLLLDRKANVEHRAKTGLTPLMEAASGGYVDVGRVLLDKNADVNAPPVPSSRDTALTIAADKGHYRFVELLLSRGAQVDVRNKKGNSSLWLAANGGHIDVVQLLYSAGADIDSQDNRKVSCLMAAFRKGHSKVVKWMVKHVAQYPSDQELTRYIATINDKDLLKKCNTCMDIIRVAKDRQAAEAAKNANSLLEELDREKNIEESKKAAAARKREKKKRKKMEKKGGKDDLNDAKCGLDDDDDMDIDGKDDGDPLTGTEDEKEKTPEILDEPAMRLDHHSSKGSGKGLIGMNSNSNEGDSGIDANSQGSSASREDKMEGQGLQNNKDLSNDFKDQTTKKTKNKSKKGKINRENTNTSSKERERNERNAASSLSPSDHEPTPPLPNATSQQLKISSNDNGNIIGFNKNENSTKIYQQTFGKQSSAVTSSTTMTNQYVKAIGSQQYSFQTEHDNNSTENKENKKQQQDLSYSDQLEYSRNDTRVPQTPDQQVVINTFDPSSVQLGSVQSNKKVGRGRRNFTSSGSSQLEPHDGAYSRVGASTGTKQLLSAPNNLTTANSPRKGGPTRGGGNSGTNSGNNRNTSGVVEDAGWKEVVRKSRKVVVSANAISRVIGRGGNNINAIRELSGAHIEVEKQGKGGSVGSDRTILIKGSADSTRQASAWINSVISNPDKDLSEIIGKPYRQLQAQQQSGTANFLSSMVQQTVIVTNSGTTCISNPTPTTTFSSSATKSVITPGQVPQPLVQTFTTPVASVGGFTALIGSSKSNNSGGTSFNTKLTGSHSASVSLATPSIIAPPAAGNKNGNRDNLKDVKDKKLGKTNANIPAFTSGLTASSKPGASNSSDKGNKQTGIGSFAAVAGGVEQGMSSASVVTTPSFGMISSGGPHPGASNNPNQLKSKSSGKLGAASGMISLNHLDSRTNKTNTSQFSLSSVVQSGQYSVAGHGVPSRSAGVVTSSSGCQLKSSSTSNPDHNMGQGQLPEKDQNYMSYGKSVSQNSHPGITTPGATKSVQSGSGRISQSSIDNKDYSPFKTLGVVSWGAPNLSAMDSSKEDKLGTANWASHLPNIGSSSRMNNNGQKILQPPPSIPLPPSANTERGTDTLTSSDIELNKTANQDLASKAPGYRANLNASPSWGPISNANLASSKPVSSASSNTADVLLYQQQQERCNSAPGTPMSPVVPSPIGPPTSVKSGASSNVSPGSEDGNLQSYGPRGGIGPIGQTTGFGSGRSITPDDMEYRRRAGISNIDNKESILGSISTVQNMSRQPNNSAGHPSSSLANKNTMLDHSSDLNILNAAAQMAASGSSFNEFLSQQASKGFGGPNSNFTDMMNVNNGSNSSVLNQSAGNSSSRLIGPPGPPPLPPSMTAGIYNQNLATKLNPNAPDFMRLQGPPGATDFIRAPGPSGNQTLGLGRNLSSVTSSANISNKYPTGNQYGSQVSISSRMSFGHGNNSSGSNVGHGPNQMGNVASSSNQLVSNLNNLSNFSNILNNQSINALLNQANLSDLSAAGNGAGSFDNMSATLVGGKSIREINEMLSGSGNSAVVDQTSQPFAGNGSSLFVNNPLVNQNINNSNLEEQPKSKAIGSERHRPNLPNVGLQTGLPSQQQSSNPGPMPPNLMNKSLPLNRIQAGVRAQAPSNPWDNPGYYEGSGDHVSRQNLSNQAGQQFPFPSSLQGHTLESLLKSTVALPSSVDTFGEHSVTATGTSSANFIHGLGNGGTSGAPPSPLSGLGSPANITPSKNDFIGGFGGPGGDAGMNFSVSQQAPIGSAGKNLGPGYALDSAGGRSNDPAVNSVRRNMNAMWGNSGSISTKKWGDEM